MLDKIELPKGVKGDHTWCDLNSRSQIWETLGEEYKKDNVCYGLFHFEEQVRERQKIQKHLKRTTAWDNIINLRKKWKGICSQVPFIVLKYRQGCI